MAATSVKFVRHDQVLEYVEVTELIPVQWTVDHSGPQAEKGVATLARCNFPINRLTPKYFLFLQLQYSRPKSTSRGTLGSRKGVSTTLNEAANMNNF